MVIRVYVTKSKAVNTTHLRDMTTKRLSQQIKNWKESWKEVMKKKMLDPEFLI